MNIATQGGSIIVKDGLLAENCGCCGGWYCDVSGGGACCESGAAGSSPTCSIKPECDCKGEGKVFRGVGTTCTPSPCLELCTPTCSAPPEVTVQITVSDPVAVANIPISFLLDGTPIYDPFHPAVPGWAASCYSSLKNFASGTYVLKSGYVHGLPAGWSFISDCTEARSAGGGVVSMGKPYFYKDSSVQIQYCLSCSMLPDIAPSSPSYSGRLLSQFNGRLVVNVLVPECNASGYSYSLTTGPLITDLCGGTSMSGSAAAHAVLGFVPMFAIFVKNFPDRTESVGFQSGVHFPLTATFS